MKSGEVDVAVVDAYEDYAWEAGYGLETRCCRSAVRHHLARQATLC